MLEANQITSLFVRIISNRTLFEIKIIFQIWQLEKVKTFIYRYDERTISCIVFHNLNNLVFSTVTRGSTLNMNFC